MKKILLITMVMLVPTVAFAQPGNISLYSDVTGVDCNIVDAAAGLLVVTAVHTGTNAAAGIQFSAPIPSCFTGSFLSNASNFAVILGNTEIGVSVGYGVCQTAPVWVLDITLFASGTSPTCCLYPTLPHPLVGDIVMNDCAFVDLIAAGGVATINGDGTCACGVDPVEESTWGSIKNIFSSDAQ